MSFYVIGAGTWGVPLAQVLAENNHHVTVWHYKKDFLDLLNKKRIHPNLDDIKLSSKIYFNSNLESCNNSDWIISALPCQVTRKVLSSIQIENTSSKNIIGVAKGIERGSGKTISKILCESLGISLNNICILSGPTHAEEVMHKIPTAIVAASSNISVAKKVQNYFSNEYFRVYRSDDTLGVELGGSVKNVISIAAGICVGAGYGDNTIAALLSRGNHEISRLGEMMGANKNTFSGLSGIGDLIVTATSKHSRNRRVGVEIGKGRKLNQILSEMDMVAEGVWTAKALYQLAGKWKVEMPICNQIYDVLFNEIDPILAISKLMKRTLISEST